MNPTSVTSFYTTTTTWTSGCTLRMSFDFSDTRRLRYLADLRKRRGIRLRKTAQRKEMHT